MLSQVSLKFALQGSDYTKALRLFNTHRASNLAVGLALSLLAILAAAALVLRGFEPRVFAFAALTCLALIYSHVIHPELLGGRAHRDNRFTTEELWNLSDHQITVGRGSSQSSVPWEHFHDYLETRDYFLLVPSHDKRAFRIIPKRAFDSLGDEQEFRRLLASNLPHSQKPFCRKHWRLLLTIVAILTVNVLAAIILLRAE